MQQRFKSEVHNVYPEEISNIFVIIFVNMVLQHIHMEQMLL